MTGTPEAGLADLLRTRTHALHRQAEQSGIVVALLQGRASRSAYALLLRNLLPAYRALEEGLERHREKAALAAIARPPVYRAQAIESDLRALQGPHWQASLPLLDAGARYAARVAQVSEGHGERLVAHAYARYLGDLNGGRILCRLLSRSLGLGPESLAFYAYPGVDDLDAFKASYRRAFDAATAHVDPEAVADEALHAFRLNVALSEEVARTGTETVAAR